MRGGRSGCSRVLAGAAVMLALVSAGFAQHPIPESERWATITHAGNEAYLADVGTGTPLPLGRVEYEYQISKTEVTGGEWLEFVNACAPYVDPFWRDNGQFTSGWINRNISGQYVLSSSGRNRPVSDIGWHFAARYVNWLHNGKGTEREDFEQARTTSRPSWSSRSPASRSLIRSITTPMRCIGSPRRTNG